MGLILEQLVLSNGCLDDRKVWKREIVYKGTNGRNVERFYVSSGHSYIFKPLTNEEQLGKETWVYEQVLVHFPSFYPKIMAKSTGHVSVSNWIIFEDVGHLNHVFSEEVALHVTKLISYWHSYSIDKLLSVPLKGPKPFIDEIIAYVLLKKNEVVSLFRRYQIPQSIIEKIYFLLPKYKFTKRRVLSHGDLHLGNYAINGNRVIVLDWEHAHLNDPYWDLYHLLDISHPIFSKQVTATTRENVLDYYLEQLEHPSLTQILRQAFKMEYYLFSCTFSIWMILLIHGDLNRQDERWNKDQLIRQLNETIYNLIQCAEQIASKVNSTY